MRVNANIDYSSNTFVVIIESTHVFISDVSGLLSSKMARAVYFNKIDGIILVFDTSNKRSYINIQDWLHEFYSSFDASNNSDKRKSKSFFPQILVINHSNENKRNRVPLFIIGNVKCCKRVFFLLIYIVFVVEIRLPFRLQSQLSAAKRV